MRHLLFIGDAAPREAENSAVFERLISALIRIPVRVDGREISPLLRQIFQSENGSHRANRNARAAIDAFHWANVKLRLGFKFGFILARVNAVNRANVHASGVLGSYTGLSNYVRHRDSPSRDICN
jgi:hypothetical protein